MFISVGLWTSRLGNLSGYWVGKGLVSMAGDRGWNLRRGLGALSMEPEVLRVIPELRDLDFCILLLKVIKSIWPAYNFIIVQQMGIEGENYVHRFRTGTLSAPPNFQAFQQELLSSLDASCDLFISPIFTNEALLQSQLDLDQCFVPARSSSVTQMKPLQISNSHIFAPCSMHLSSRTNNSLEDSKSCDSWRNTAYIWG